MSVGTCLEEVGRTKFIPGVTPGLTTVNGLTTRIRLDLRFILGLLQVLPIFIDTLHNHISAAIDKDAFDIPGSLHLT